MGEILNVSSSFDLDGVLAGWDFLRLNRGFIDKSKVDLINQLKGCEVVISSSWGVEADKPLKEVGLELPIIGHTEHFSLGREWLCRGNEIDKWLIDTFGGLGTKFGANYASEKYKYVIFDDDCDMLLGQKDNFIQTDERTGLTQEDIDKAKKILEIEDDNILG